MSTTAIVIGLIVVLLVLGVLGVVRFKRLQEQGRPYYFTLGQSLACFVIMGALLTVVIGGHT